MQVCASALLCCLMSLAAAAQVSLQPADAVPVFDGFVTAITPQRIDVNGAHLRFTPKSLVEQRKDRNAELTSALPDVYLGEPAKVYGKYDKHTETVTVEQLTLTLPSTVQVSGIGIIDATSTPGLVRADGRLLSVTPKAIVTFVPPLTSASPLHTNLWIKYRGEQTADGIVLVREAEVRENVVAASEDRLRQKNEYDPAAVDPDSHQSATSKLFRGLQISQIPPWPDSAMQERIERIGRSLIPAYQRALPESDPTKLHFRFQVIDEKHFKDAITLPNGIIVVPHQVVERLENDTQVATVLADNIATAIEKQSFRSIPARQRLSAAEIAGTAGGLLVPGLGLATAVANSRVAKHMLTVQEQQSGRVSLGYLHDAGFDVSEAAATWWLLETKPSRSLAQAILPQRAANLFAELGRGWRTTVHSAPRENPPVLPAP